MFVGLKVAKKLPLGTQKAVFGSMTSERYMLFGLGVLILFLLFSFFGFVFACISGLKT